MNAFASATNDLIESQLRAGNRVQFTLTTRSMLPTLTPGDQITVRGVRNPEPRIGDIVLVHVNGLWLAHRLIAQRVLNAQIRFITQGDNCTESDSLWSQEQIYGIIVVVKQNGTVRSFESKRARLCGTLIAQLLRWRSGLGTRRLFLQVNAALVRAAVWLFR